MISYRISNLNRLLSRAIRITAALILFVVPASFIGCGPLDRPVDASQNQIDVDAEIEAIMLQSRRLSDAYVAGDVADLVSIYESDGIAAPGGRDFVQGHEALTGLWALPEGRAILRHSATPVELVVDGDHAYDRGYYEGLGAQDGVELKPFRGAYVIVWHKSPDNIWRIAVDMWYTL